MIQAVPMKRKYTDEEISQFAAQALRDGYYLLRNHFPKAKIINWREATLPLLEKQIEIEGQETSRGSSRYYVTYPFSGPFADPTFYEDPDILALVEILAGKNFVMCQLASDTPVLGSDFQEIHRDCPPLFPELKSETPMFQLALNFPLVDVTPQNGPLEIARGTHMMSREEGLRKIEAGETFIEPIPMQTGDVLLRDVRTLHRGTPNKTNEPRPMVVIGYSRSWMHRPEVSVRITRAEFAKLTPTAKHMLRFNPMVDDLETNSVPESYTSFQY
jgi:hypothetical protein